MKIQMIMVVLFVVAGVCSQANADATPFFLPTEDHRCMLTMVGETAPGRWNTLDPHDLPEPLYTFSGADVWQGTEHYTMSGVFLLGVFPGASSPEFRVYIVPGITEQPRIDLYATLTPVYDVSATPIPEPATLAVLALGGLVTLMRRKRTMS